MLATAVSVTACPTCAKVVDAANHVIVGFPEPELVLDAGKLTYNKPPYTPVLSSLVGLT